MAPGRRKGRATAAAAASQLQWKIGDLVLAKVKGFPPWPAVISDPQKWGYSSDRRKLFVYFFGTKQIAFCNHADVEAFTEEKRRLLLGKRHGKGMDFIRAVDEIIENFERLTKHMVNDELCSGDDVESHLYNVEDTGANHSKDSQKESFSTSNGASETFFSERSNDSDSSEEIPATLMEDDTAQNKGMAPGHQSCQVSIVDRLRNIPLVSNALARRSRYLSHSSYTQKRTLSHQRSRSKTGINSCEFQKNEGRVEDENDGNHLLSEEMTDDCSFSDNIAKRKCLDVHDTSSEVSNLAGNNQFEDTAFGTTEVEQGAYSPNERCVMESNCNGKSIVKNKAKDHAVDRGFEAQRNFVVLKKKRKPSKKHSDQEAEKLRSESSTCQPISLDSWHNPKDRLIQKDGDEHLPLVKRARVRMGNIPEEKKINDFVGMVGKSENDILPSVRNLSSSSDGSCGPHETSRSGFDGSLPADDQTSTVGHVTGMHWKERNCPSRGNAIDMEAALPPSKRLSRALEAMSVNATKSNDGPLEASTFISSCGRAQVSKADPCCILLDGKCNSLRKSDAVSSPDMNPKPSSRNSLIVNACVEPSTEAKLEDISRESCLTFQCMNCEAKDKDIDYSEELPNFTVTTGLNDRNHQPSSSLVIGERKEAVSHPIVDDSMDDNVVDSAALNATESLVSPCDDKHGIDLLELAVGSHFNTSSNGSGFSSDSNSAKNLIVASQAEGPFSQAGYLAENNHAKPVIDEKRSDKLSPKNSTVSQAGLVVEGTAGNLHSGDKSPNSIQQVNESAQLMGITKMQSDNSSDQNEKIPHRSSTLDEATTARKSFENLVSTLSRTKESIGRATRVALECMKHGIAGEVVQILVHNLEMTVNLSRKLDLFFLVDSITQRSRLHKGFAGDSYPCLFQPVLSRLLLAAAPPGNNECDNHRQCLKVLKLWHDRRILPKSVVQSHIQELESTSEASFPPRAERALSDPIREMEGMLVDEYGSNASFQIPSASKSHWVEGEGEEEGSAGTEKSFETVTPVHDSKTSKEAEIRPDSFSDKHTLILEDVDGELEMEDVSPHCPNGEIFPYEPGQPPLPADKPPSPPPLPSSPPPGVPLCRPVLSLIPPSAAPPNHVDDLASHSFPARNSVQYSLSSRGPCVPNMDLRQANGGPQMQLSSSPCHYQRSYGYPLGGPQPSVCGTNDAPPMRNSKGYHLQPPPPSSTSKLSHDQAEKHNPPRYWRERNHSSPYHRRLQFPNEAQGGSHSYSNGYSRRPVHSEMSERCSRFSPTARSGPKFPAKAEGSPGVLPHCGPRAQVSSVRNGWSSAPRGSSYRFPVTASRPPLENKVSRVAGAPDYWRPR